MSPVIIRGLHQERERGRERAPKENLRNSEREGQRERERAKGEIEELGGGRESTQKQLIVGEFPVFTHSLLTRCSHSLGQFISSRL